MPCQPGSATAAVAAKPALAVLEGSHTPHVPVCEPDDGMPLTALRADDKSPMASGLPLCVPMYPEICDGPHAVQCQAAAYPLIERLRYPPAVRPEFGLTVRF